MRKHFDSSRKAKADAAVRHAEQIMKESNAKGAILFRPNATSRAHPSELARTALKNPAMELALRDLLNLPAVKPPSLVKYNAAITASKPLIPSPIPTSAKPKRIAKVSHPKNALTKRPIKKTKLPTSGKNSPARAKKAKSAKAIVARPPSPSEQERKRAAEHKRQNAVEQTAATRRAFNARLTAIAANQSKVLISPFAELKRRWHSATVYLFKFGDANPDAPDVVAAQKVLTDVEAEWERRFTLKPGDDDYFPWPSTNAAIGLGTVSPGDWQEIGMLSYLGYHVGQTSRLNVAQRTGLLVHVFSMRLPPINSLHYMREWGEPKSGVRLRKIADGIASFTRNAKRRRNSNLAEAIRQWEADLAYLKRTLYNKCFDFVWPPTAA